MVDELTSTRLRRIIAWAALGVILLWASAVAIDGLRARNDLREAQQDLVTARTALAAARLTDAEAALEAASRSLGRATHTLGRWHVRTAAGIPVVGNSLDVARNVAEGAAQITNGARQVTGHLRQLADQRIEPDVIPVDAMASLQAPLEDLHKTTVAATAAVSDSPNRFLLPPVENARAEFLELAAETSARAGRAADLIGGLTSFLGGDGPRRYFLAASNPAEARGTGGYLGAFAIARFDAGHFSIGEFQALNELPNLSPDAVTPPTDWFQERYRRYGGTGHWQNLNMTAHFPAAATAIERLWEATTGERLDGTIVVDPFAFEALLAASGPIELPDGSVIDASNVVDYVTNTAYAEITDPDVRKAVLGDVAKTTLDRFLGDFDAGQLEQAVTLFGELLAQEHVMAHSREADVQGLFETHGVAGALADPPGDFLSVTTNSATASKVDYYTSRSLKYRVALGKDGTATADLTVTLTNESPTSGVPRYVIGPNTPGLEAGDNRLLVSAYAPTHATFERGTSTTLGPTMTQVEEGHPVASTWLEVPAGESKRLEYGWTMTDAWHEDAGEVVYRLTYDDQVTIRPTEFSVDVVVPNGFELAAQPPGASIEDGVSRWHGTGRDKSLVWRFAPREA